MFVRWILPVALLFAGARNVYGQAAAKAQTKGQTAETLGVAGGTEQAPLLRIQGRAYVDLESLARITHGSLRYQGNEIILTLPDGGSSAAAPAKAASTPTKPPQISAGFSTAEVQALSAIREWHAALVNAVQSNTPVTADWTSPLRRTADDRVQMAAAAASTSPDQQTLALLRNELQNMEALSDGFVATHAQVTYIAPDSFHDNAQDAKIVSCEQALAAMAASKQFSDQVSCH